MTVNWKLPEHKAAIIMGEYKSIYEKVGPERFTAAVESMLATRESEFFPTINEFHAYIPVLARRPYCGKCVEGWIYVPDLEAKRLYKNETAMMVKFCECRKARKA